ncbi:Response regulator of zinc sigma-54-dependent two-component system [Enhygromyxa salina]|uniref:Response regulator of zinc sigma-54-dependent two-component system n=1 Tax=Enhygromyxa salina TaxID=215803 RepID=A0A0C1ZJU6_9BACT|nr:sigma 54-interacting transcriptional regulator [Enhygromyxa salina]KIG17724.1 Response regulator of zinc sigma-54-dependent two-component system [Enhygromyxa salina]
MSASTPVVLISWVSISGGAAPLLTALADPSSPYKGRVEHIYLCRRKGPGDDRETTALEQTKKQLREHPLAKAAKLVVQTWKTKASPIEHLEIREFAERVLAKARDDHPGVELVIHLSPGTPAMHAIWLLLGSTGFVAEPVTLIQTADIHGREAGNPPVQIANVNVNSWLRRYRSMRLSRTDSIDDGQLWDPSLIQSEALAAAVAKLDRWAPIPAPVLLLGERGSGKTSFAARLRVRSPFTNPDLVEWPVVVCGQFRSNPALARSELFGHVEGAFSGANKDRVGWLKIVDGDSLFLDEIADIDDATQRMLIAAIEGRGFHRLGDSELQRSSFRLISATNRTLAELRGGVLDADFLDRIAVFVLRIPPLRECREDLPVAWARVLGRIAARIGVDPQQLQALQHEKRIIKLLSTHPLPGNFRDLERASYHLLAMLGAGAGLDELVNAVSEGIGSANLRTSERVDIAHIRAQLPLSEGQFEAKVDAFGRPWLLAALEYGRDNKAEAARALGLKRSTFTSKLKALDLADN